MLYHTHTGNKHSYPYPALKWLLSLTTIVSSPIFPLLTQTPAKKKHDDVFSDVSYKNTNKLLPPLVFFSSFDSSALISTPSITSCLLLYSSVSHSHLSDPCRAFYSHPPSHQLWTKKQKKLALLVLWLRLLFSLSALLQIISSAFNICISMIHLEHHQFGKTTTFGRKQENTETDTEWENSVIHLFRLWADICRTTGEKHGEWWYTSGDHLSRLNPRSGTILDFHRQT